MSGLRQRAITAIVLLPLAVALVLWLPEPWFALVLTMICSLALAEWARLVGIAGLAQQVAFALLNASIMLALWLLRDDGALRTAVFVGACWWPLAALWLGHYSFGEAVRQRNSLLKLFAGSLAVVPAWSAAVLLHDSSTRGPWWLLFVFALVWCADIFAYFTGRKFGRTKIAPRISPGKTHAGVYGALASSTAFAAIAGAALGLRGLPLLLLLGLSIVTVAFSIVGDLFESLIKRHSNKKDSGSVFPGHGGVFDRLDSLFAALPVFVTGKLLLGL